MQQYFQKEAFVHSTCQQILKDIAGLSPADFNLEIDVKDQALEQIMHQLRSVLNRMNSQQIQQFIYRVDLKESLYVQALSNEDELSTLTFLIIRREAQKVYLRSKLS